MTTLTIPVGAHDHARGPESAPVTLVEYGDYQCPFCGAAYPVVTELERRFGQTLRVVFRHFPLTQAHPRAEPAAEAAEAAAAAGKFWEMHDQLYTHQDALDDRHLARYAHAAGVAPTAVEEALEAHTYLPHIRADFLGGVRSGVNGTPTFFINVRRHDGGYDVAELAEAITAAS
jgi:protein-disulfide isomerase